MLGITATPDGEAIVLADRDGGTLRVEPPVDGEPLPTTLSRVGTSALADAAAGRWLSERLGTRGPARLARRPAPALGRGDHGGRPGDVLNLADAGPLLLASTASLRRLDDWIAEGAVERGEEPPAPLPMERFRPTVVVDGAEPPFAEDELAPRADRRGLVPLRRALRPLRADDDRHARRSTGGKEPLRTLARHRQWDHKTWFGVRLVPETTGVVRVGDPVVARVATAPRLRHDQVRVLPLPSAEQPAAGRELDALARPAHEHRRRRP